MSVRTYARVQGGVVAEVLGTTADVESLFNPALKWLDITATPNVGIGWIYDGKNFTPPTQQPNPTPLPTLQQMQTQLSALQAQVAALTKAG